VFGVLPDWLMSPMQAAAVPMLTSPVVERSRATAPQRGGQAPVLTNPGDRGAAARPATTTPKAASAGPQEAAPVPIKGAGTVGEAQDVTSAGGQSAPRKSGSSQAL